MSLELCSIGDIMLGENTHHYGRGIPTLFQNRYDQLISKEVRLIINTSDVLFANFECNLIPDKEWSTAPMIRAIYAAPENSTCLFDSLKPQILLNIANNHFGQHGHKVADFTIQCFEQIGIKCFGRDCSPRIVSVQDRNLVCWGASLKSSNNSKQLYFKTSPELLISEMKWPDKRSEDIWVLSLHWGREYFTMPELWQQELARELVQKGVDIILGHHPHVIQPVQLIDNSIVCYSHGNFIFDQNFSRQTQEGLICQISHENGELNTILTRQHNYIVDLQQTGEQSTLNYCKTNYSRWMPLKMRIAMKLELMLNISSSNAETFVYFCGRIRLKLNRCFLCVISKIKWLWNSKLQK